MCLITFAYQSHPEYPLILVANRDEFYERPARPAQFWVEEGHPDILAGKDLLAKGTWLGLHKNGKWAVLTNYRDIENIKDDAPSRGDLVLNYLKSSMSAKEYATLIKKDDEKYNGFNILIADQEEIIHLSNYSKELTVVEKGIHSLSNALLNTPWYKVRLTKDRLKDKIAQNSINTDSLFEVLFDKSLAADDDLPKTGLSYDLEKAVSASFIITPNYGTRCTTVLKINQQGEISFSERTFVLGSDEVEYEMNYEL